MSYLEELITSSRDFYQASSLESRYPTIISEKSPTELCVSCVPVTEGHNWYGFCTYTNDSKTYSGKASIYSDDIPGRNCLTVSRRENDDIIAHINRPAFLCMNGVTNNLEVLVPTFESDSSKNMLYRAIGSVPVEKCSMDRDIYVKCENLIKVLDLCDRYNKDASKFSSVAWQFTELFGSEVSRTAVMMLMRAASGKEYESSDISCLEELADNLEDLVKGLRDTANTLNQILADDEADSAEDE